MQTEKSDIKYHPLEIRSNLLVIYRFIGSWNWTFSPILWHFCTRRAWRTDGKTCADFIWWLFLIIKIYTLYTVSEISMKFMNSITCRNEMKSQFEDAEFSDLNQWHRTFSIWRENKITFQSHGNWKLYTKYILCGTQKNRIYRPPWGRERAFQIGHFTIYLFRWSVNVSDSSEWFFLL